MSLSHSVEVTTGPTFEPISLAKMKLHLRVEHDADDTLIADFIRQAREAVEDESGVKLATQTVTVTFARFPCGGELLELPVRPVASVTSVTYRRAEDGASTALTSFQTWLSRRTPALAPPVADGVWPGVDERYVNPVSVVLIAGKASASVPAVAVAAIKLIVGYWYGFRGNGKDTAGMESIPGEAGMPAGAVRLMSLLAGQRYW